MVVPLGHVARQSPLGHHPGHLCGAPLAAVVAAPAALDDDGEVGEELIPPSLLPGDGSVCCQSQCSLCGPACQTRQV